MSNLADITQYDFFSRLKAQPCVEAIYLYGSRARGDALERSDIDLAIACPNAKAGDWLEILAIAEEADTLLHVDVTRYDEIPEGGFKQRIDRDKQVLFRKESAHG